MERILRLFTVTSNIKPYIHKVQYHETDEMQVVHHSNYVLWMEEARDDFLSQIDFNWSEIELNRGIMIPVLYQSVTHKAVVRFGDSVIIDCKLTHFDGVKMDFSYSVKDLKTDMIRAIGETHHGFINTKFQPVMLQREYEQGYDVIMKYLKLKEL